MFKRLFCVLVSIVIVSLGQPALVPPFGILVALGGLVPLFWALLDLPQAKRFWIGTGFFFSVQLVELFWLTSHPYNYIWAVYFILACILGLQFGVLCIFIERKKIFSLNAIFAAAGLWTLLEWSRLFYFTGFTFNPLGLAVALSPLGQLVSIIGIYGLSFFVIASNLVLLRSFLINSRKFAALFCLLPFVAGGILLFWHTGQMKQHDASESPLRALIIASRLLPEEVDGVKTAGDLIQGALTTWEDLVRAIEPYKDEKFDLILFPEIVVPFPAGAPIFPLEQAKGIISLLEPSASLELASYSEKDHLFISSLSIAKAISKIFHCPLIIGLEAMEYHPEKKRSLYFNSAFYVTPDGTNPPRYDKQILLPGGEYIPYEWAKSLIEKYYGLTDSFQRGKKRILFESNRFSIATSICYEDTFPNFATYDNIAEATLLVNLTSDAWYPNSLLGKYHLEHARLRAVELGLPFLRSCNFGTSGAINSLGKTVTLVDFEDLNHPVEAIPVEVSTYTHATWYAIWGNVPILIISIFTIFIAILRGRLSPQLKSE
jgi:apolipoprotein N-acyltransferase